MGLNIKKLAAGLLVVPLLVLGIGVFGATPAYAKACADIGTIGTAATSVQFTGACTDDKGNTTYWSKGVKKTKDEFCKLDSGLRAGIECARGDDQVGELTGQGGIVTTVINIMLFVIGILCVIMIIFGGIRYTTSTGDKTKVDAAKNTIIYAVVGLIVAIVAWALVNWVFGALTT